LRPTAFRKFLDLPEVCLGIDEVLDLHLLELA